ncbi:MAG: diguanylate cyclase [Thermodesulfobacteriota bacterium]
MDLYGPNNLSLKLLVEYLSDEHRTLSMNPREWDQLEKHFGEKVYSEILYLLTHLKLEPEMARIHWYNILAHREAINAGMGRDVGLRVAICDYFINIQPKLKNLVFLEVHQLLQKERTALVDELTGLYNRRFFNSVLQRELEHARRFDQFMSLLMIDVDNFKNYNDLYGHKNGDGLLAELADLLKKTARSIDYVVRYGGEEFVVLLPMCDHDRAALAGERLRRTVEEHLFSGQERMPSGNLTVTIGYATFPSDAQEGLDLFQRADEALYRGKSGGRNRVIRWEADKRRFTRYLVELETLYRRLEASSQDYNQGLARDISLGGLLHLTDEPQEVGTTLEIVLTGADSQSLRLRATVVRLTKSQEKEDEYYLGLSFHLGSPEEEEALKALITNKTGLSPDLSSSAINLQPVGSA